MPKAALPDMKPSALRNRRQVAALPFRRNDAGQVEILIITSRETGRFIIPKGWPMKGMTDFDAAAKEARQEAGVSGKIKRKAIGSYCYWKRLDQTFELVTVDVFPMQVTEHRQEWRERGQRRMAWLPVEDAASLIDEGDLADLIRYFAKLDS